MKPKRVLDCTHSSAVPIQLFSLGNFNVPFFDRAAEAASRVSSPAPQVIALGLISRRGGEMGGGKGMKANRRVCLGRIREEEGGHKLQQGLAPLVSDF